MRYSFARKFDHSVKGVGFTATDTAEVEDEATYWSKTSHKVALGAVIGGIGLAAAGIVSGPVAGPLAGVALWVGLPTAITGAIFLFKA